ncbi:hypothetical protein QJS04_geneDACA019718 [Acorus gramineus]|uniref:Uncharacterized protein n=1 Tax=Acorus gramineus TaxID=55184 RepID=A0AAV9BTM6_ACOGR|nr:hypothetical protein QJS04_geneDACA019718 [Acorus gramineus]
MTLMTAMMKKQKRLKQSLQKRRMKKQLQPHEGRLRDGDCVFLRTFKLIFYFKYPAILLK